MKKALIVTALAKFVKSFLTNDIKILQKLGYQVHCAANINHVGAECMEEYFEDMNVVFHQIAFSSNKPFSSETIISYKQMRHLLKSNDFDIIHCHTPIAGAITRVAAIKQKRKGATVLYTTHGFYFHKHASKKNCIIFRTIEDIMSYLSDAIITINREDYNNANKLHCKNVYYIPGVGVDTQKYIDMDVNRKKYRETLGLREDDFLVLAVGELSNRKNHQIIIKALENCDIPNTVFMICGVAMNADNTREKLINMAKEMNVDLRLMGLRDDIAQICKCADVGVMPSTREGLGLSGIEMMAAGLPVVASNVHGIVDYVKDGMTGFLCDPYDANAFSIAIHKAYKAHIDRNMVENCIEMAKRFDVSKSICEMTKIYAYVDAGKEI